MRGQVGIHRAVGRAGATVALIAVALAGMVVIAPPAAAVPPVLSQDLGDRVVAPGGQVTFEVATSNGLADFEFQASRDGGTTWAPAFAACGGQQSCGFSFSPQIADDGMLLRVVVSNASGSTTSRVATLHVCSPTSCLVSSFTVAPSADLISGQTVLASGSAFPALLPISVAVCAVGGPCRPGTSTVTDANGVFSLNIAASRTVRQQNCQITGGCVVQVRSSGVPIASAPISFVAVQPDVLFQERKVGGLLLFDNVYESIPNLQQRGHAIATTGTFTYALRIQNDGAAADDIVVKARGGDAHTTLHYNVGFFDVTASITSTDGFRYTAMQPGQIARLGVTFETVDAGPGPHSVLITATSGADPSASDSIALSVTV